MMNTRTIDIGVGAFIVIGVLAFVFLAVQVSGLTMSTNAKTYKVYAFFTNVGALKTRAKVTISGVTVGRVTSIMLDREMFTARVEMVIDEKVDNIPIDSSAAVVTSGILGEQYINMSIGGVPEYLKAGDRIEDTQSAIVLEDLIHKLFVAFVNKKDDG